jgi:hypothetical protein
MYTVYRNHLGGTIKPTKDGKGYTGRPSSLEALCGSTEAFGELQTIIDAAQAEKAAKAAPDAEDDAKLLSAEECQAIIKKFLLAKASEGVSILAQLKQSTDSDGELTDRYEVDRLFFNNEKERQSLERRAAQLAKNGTGKGRGLKIAYEAY